MEKNRQEKRLTRHTRVRKKVLGNGARPRLSVFRTSRHIYAQLIDDMAGKTLVSASTLDPELRGKFKHGGNKEAACLVGELIASRAASSNMTEAVFDRGGFRYHGCIKALADKAREKGLKF
ncbi:MAG: 50S ribosomal protein L18 [Candidatus Wallbacteria bacterium]|nr:50S ribosomal protein L18 [Candidatus Wallbacteria bacterium]